MPLPRSLSAAFLSCNGQPHIIHSLAHPSPPSDARALAPLTLPPGGLCAGHSTASRAYGMTPRRHSSRRKAAGANTFSLSDHMNQLFSHLDIWPAGGPTDNRNAPCRCLGIRGSHGVLGVLTASPGRLADPTQRERALPRRSCWPRGSCALDVSWWPQRPFPTGPFPLAKSIGSAPNPACPVPTSPIFTAATLGILRLGARSRRRRLLQRLGA